MSTKPLWLGREIVGVPSTSRIVYPAGARGIAIVAIPRLELFVVTEHGQVRVPDEEHDGEMADFFDAARST